MTMKSATPIKDGAQSKKRSVLSIARRSFLMSAGVIGGGLLVGAGWVAYELNEIDHYKPPLSPGEIGFGAWLKVARDGKIDILTPNQDMGQGIYALAALTAADGLKAPLDLIRVVPAPVNARYGNAKMLIDSLPFNPEHLTLAEKAFEWTFEKLLRVIGLQATGGSASTRNIAPQIHEAAGVMLDLLTRAAANHFNAPEASLTIADGFITAADGRRASYGELASAASGLEPHPLKTPVLQSNGLIGKGAPRFDVPLKTHGQTHYGIDVCEEKQLYAAIRHAPRFGAMLKSASLSAAVPGVRGIVEGRAYVAAVAESFAMALNGLDKITAEWDESNALTLSTADVFTAYRKALDQGESYEPRWVIEKKGDPSQAVGSVYKAVYQAPFLAHATMEPMNATALVSDGRVKVWAGHQSPKLAQIFAARGAGLDNDLVDIVTPYLGGGFGRRVDMDYIQEAVEIAKKYQGAPVQTIWTRDEDMRHDYYRPAALADIAATLGPNGLPTSFSYRIAAPSVNDQFLARIRNKPVSHIMADISTVSGALFSFYHLPNRHIENVMVDTGVPVGSWRSVGFSINCFFMESFIDELAARAKIHPLDYRSMLLDDSENAVSAKRARVILEAMKRYHAAYPLAKDASGNWGRGFALTECFNSYVGQIADVQIVDGGIAVHRVYAIVDCGMALDPLNVIAQVRGGIQFATTAALFGRIDLVNGAVQQANFDSYPMVTLANAPTVDVELLNSGAPLGGVGEIGVPGAFPAIGNAIFAATGKRLRQTPFTV